MLIAVDALKNTLETMCLGRKVTVSRKFTPYLSKPEQIVAALKLKYTKDCLENNIACFVIFNFYLTTTKLSSSLLSLQLCNGC